MAANSSEMFYITKEFLKNLWSDVLLLIDKQNKRREVEHFLRNTNKHERTIYENSMIMDAAQIHFPKNCLLARNEHLKGIWMSLSFAGDQKPQRLSYGTQCIILPSYGVINYLRTNIQTVEEEDDEEEREDKREKEAKQNKKKEVQESDLQEEKIMFKDEEVEILYRREGCPETGDEDQRESRRKKCRKEKIIVPRRDLMEELQKRKWTREDFLRHPNEKKLLERKQKINFKDCLEETKTKDPLLFFENAYYFNKSTQYVRMVLISAWDINVKWCSENLLQIPLHKNPVLQLKDGVVMTVSDIHPKLVVEVLVVGDIELRKISEHSWFSVRKLPRAGKEPVIAVLPPINYSFR